MPPRNDGIRGLSVFISDIRNCKSKEAELKRINKELANIRSKFKGDKNLDGYQKKKYVCKLLFIFLLGHDIDFGHMEAVNLLSSNKYTEKQIGYLFISVLVSSGNEFIKLIIQAIHNDIASRCHVFALLALHCIANINSVEMVDSFREEIPKFLVSAGTTDAIKQSCALCLLRLMYSAATNPGSTPLDLSEWSSRIMQLLNDSHMGVVTASASLLQALARINPNQYRATIALAVSRLSTIVTSAHSDLQDYSYYFVPAPWLTVKLLQLLQSFIPVAILEDTGTKNRLTECLSILLQRGNEAPKSKKIQHTNARNAVVFETINLIVHLDHDSDLMIKSCTLLGQFLQNRETNMRYLALEGLCLLATSEFSHDSVKQHQATVINSLKTEYDVSVRQRSADLLYAMCDKTNVELIVQEMLSYLEQANFSIREEMVLKVAILAEKYAVDFTWYVDTILSLIRVAGDHVSEEVWYRVIQIVINQEEVQGYAAKTVFEALQAQACHENMVKVGGYILGEFGNLIALDPNSSPERQFQTLHSKFPFCSVATRQLLLSSYVKFTNLFPEMKPAIQEVFSNDTHSRNSDVELQQRAVEYSRLSAHPSADVLATVLEEMPPFPEKETSLLLALKKRKVESSGDALAGVLTPSPSDGVTNEGLSSPSWKETTPPDQSLTPASAVSDLLDLDSALAASAPEATGSIPGQTSAAQSLAPVTHNIPQQDVLQQFISKTQGVLYEDQVIQIGVKSEYRQNVGLLRIFYGNKTSQGFIQFTSEVQTTPELSSLVQVQSSSALDSISPGGQLEQTISIQCLLPFTDIPKTNVKFRHNGVDYSFEITLPVTLNKFMSGMSMDSNQFFQKWKQLNQTNQEFMAVCKQLQPLNQDLMKTKLQSFGFSVLDGIDPNADNFVCVGVISSQRPIGCMARLEPNKQVQMYRLTIRSNTEGVAKQLSELLQTQL